MVYTTDDSIGSNLERLRGNMSMDMLAAKMRDKGYSWTKTTVFNIEHGKRPLRLTEAADVLVCLKVDPSASVFALLRSQEEHAWISTVGQVSLAEDQMQSAVEHYAQMINQLKNFLDNHILKDDGSDADARIEYWRSLSSAQMGVAENLGPCIQEIIGFFDANSGKMPLVFVDGEFKRLEAGDFDKDLEQQLGALGMTDFEINELRKRAEAAVLDNEA